MNELARNMAQFVHFTQIVGQMKKVTGLVG